ncbi:DUF3545 family protein [Thaumasiovibrio subtropicus]|uniref:DUF3545 family protein n=1 Tax=Thaumasiovibrio subtropicus TaxID=1891207 RepID=UPI000B357F77|nr:DUF3545 family protein [Thaumasiovibrio subtropicus]
MDSFAFDNYETVERPQRGTRSKPQKRKWREIEALKDKQRLRKELMEIDQLGDFSLDDVDI